MYRASFAALLCTVSLVAQAQTGLQGQSAKNADLTRALDNVSAALANAQRQAASGSLQSTKDALNIANVRWADCYGQYKTWATSDTAWQPNFESINSALLNAVNALTPGNNLAGAKAQIDFAATTLTSLRARNKIPDIKSSAAKLDTSLKSLEAAITALQGKTLTPADIDSLQTAFGSFRDTWTIFTQDVIDVNALGLGQGKLDDLSQYVALQNVAIDSIYNILKSPDTRQLLTQWQSVRSRIADLLTSLNEDIQKSETSATADATGATDASSDATDTSKDGAGKDRPRLFPRLRRPQ